LLQVFVGCFCNYRFGFAALSIPSSPASTLLALGIAAASGVIGTIRSLAFLLFTAGFSTAFFSAIVLRPTLAAAPAAITITLRFLFGFFRLFSYWCGYGFFLRRRFTD
jgi:hypothetical protein